MSSTPCPNPPPPPLPFLDCEPGWQALHAPHDTPLDDATALTAASWLFADFYNPHPVILQVRLSFLAESSGRAAEVIFGLYPRVHARLRVPATALAQNAWLLPREGALLKPMCGGDVVRPEDVSRLRLEILAGPAGETRFWATPFAVSATEPAKLVQPASPHAALLDPLGQYAPARWPDKTPDADTLVRRLREDLARADSEAFPAHWTRWGGSASLRFDATGWFRTHHDGRRWWLVDPEGGAFWSTGPCCVSPLVEAAIEGLDHLLAWTPPADDPRWADARLLRTHGTFRGRGVNFLAANLIRAFGPADWRASWRRLAAAALRHQRFNTIANWSDLELGRESRLPYTRPLRDLSSLTVPKVFRDFPDVHDAGFPAACAVWAEQLRDTRDDPAFLGYFICNEPTWAFSKLCPAAGMLANTDEAAARAEFAAWLHARHRDDAALAAAWEAPSATFARVAAGRWEHLPASPGFTADAEAFSGLMAAQLFDTLGAACRAVDPHHLNLGARFAHLPAPWMQGAFRTFDVFSFNSYSKRPRAAAAEVAALLNKPVLIGEWHFGATDTGFPAAALETVATQRDRGLAYRRYLEAHAAAPWCVGAHWFTLYDQSALGRFDGEPYNCGFYDVCHREQSEIAAAARASHEILYDIVSGARPPEDLPAPRHLPRLSL
jgi:hypothetical protein